MRLTAATAGSSATSNIVNEVTCMMERRQIVGLWQQGQAEVLVTLVRAEGSSYRRPGARLLTAAEGPYAGTISGGCLEAEVVQKARWMVASGARVERYSMLFDDTAEIPFGLGCGGIVDLLFEPCDTPEAEALLTAMERSLAGTPSTVISFLPGGGRGLRRLVLDRDGKVLFQSTALSAEKIRCASTLTPGTDYDGRFVERLEVPQRLIILGAGDDARPLVRLAALLGWSAVVADGRAPLARKERFPEAEQVVNLDAATQLETTLGLTVDSAVVLMTHSYEQDRDLLARVLPLKPRYLGLLGSRHRSSVMVTEVAERLGWTLDECCCRIFAPVGMDLGGDGPEAIALAIAAEVQAICQGRRGVRGHLTRHDVLAQLEKGGGAERYLQAHCALDGIR